MKWNGGVSFPIQSGHPCIGCTELYFFDRMTPFYKTLPNVNGFGVDWFMQEVLPHIPDTTPVLSVTKGLSLIHISEPTRRS